MSETPSNVHTLPGKELPDQTLVIEPPARFCPHKQIALNEHRRLVKCADCDAHFDPFDFLLNEAQRLAFAWRDYKAVMAQRAELIERVDALKKEEARLKSRIKTARNKVDPVILTRS